MSVQWCFPEVIYTVSQEIACKSRYESSAVFKPDKHEKDFQRHTTMQLFSLIFLVL